MKSSALQKSSLRESFFCDGLHGKKIKNIVRIFYMLKHKLSFDFTNYCCWSVPYSIARQRRPCVSFGKGKHGELGHRDNANQFVPKQVEGIPPIALPADRFSKTKSANKIYIPAPLVFNSI